MGRVQTCPKCRALLDAGTKVCPYCDATQQAVTAASPEQDAAHTTRLGTWLLTVNVVIFFLSVQFQMGDEREKKLKPTSAALTAFGASDPELTRECGQYWRLVSANFLHIDLLHLIFNSVAILLLIPLAAVTLGAHRTLAIYFVAGVGGFLLSQSAGVRGAGASASLCGLIGALAVYGKRRGAPDLTRRMLMWAAFIGVFGLVMRGQIDNWGHAGGGLVGAALAWPASAVRAPGSRVDRIWQVGATAWILLGVAMIGAFIVPSVLRGLERHDVGVYNDETKSLLRRMKSVRDGETPVERLPESFEEGPGDSAALAAAVNAALEKTRARAPDAVPAIDAGWIALREWQHPMKCSHYWTPPEETR